jgi:hypothetical protein
MESLVNEWNKYESYYYIEQLEYGLNRFYQNYFSNAFYDSSKYLPKSERKNGEIQKKIKVSSFDNFSSGPYDYSKNGVTLPPNLYGELCSTFEGCDIIYQNGTLKQLCQNLIHIYKYSYHNNLSRQQVEKQSKIKMNQHQLIKLWSLAFCCSSNTGYQYCNKFMNEGELSNEIDENYIKANIVQYFVHIASENFNISLRGTTMYILGILSKSKLARDDLEEVGFECSFRYGIAIPTNREKFFCVPKYEFEGSSTYFEYDDKLKNNIYHSILNENNNNNNEIEIKSELINELIINTVRIANPVQEQTSYLNLQNIKLKISKQLNNLQKSKLIFYLIYYQFTFYKYKWKVIKFIINDLLGGNNSLLIPTDATNNLEEEKQISKLMKNLEYKKINSLLSNEYFNWLDSFFNFK